jgi:hypothetical protein
MGGNSLLPPGRNADWRGPTLALVPLGLLGLVKLATGLVHYLLPDGGAGSIAGIDLSANAGPIIGTFAWVGAIQIGSALVIALVIWRHRPLAPALMLIFALEQALLALSAFVLKPPLGPHPPGHWGAIGWVLLLSVGAWLAVRRPAAARRDR